MARTGEGGAAGVSAFMVEKDAPGLAFGAKEKKMGWRAQPTRQVILEGVRVPAGQSGRRRRGRLQDRDGRARRRAAQHRRLFDRRRAIGARQGDSPTCASARRSAAASPTSRRCNSASPTSRLRSRPPVRSSGARRARSTSTRPRRPASARIAKQIATDAGFNAANDALQLFGGYGYLADYGVEKLVRDLRVHQILEGTNEIMRVIVARGLIEN